MNHITKVRLIQNLSEEELKRGIKMDASWHMRVTRHFLIKKIKNSIKTAPISMLEVFLMK